MSRHREEKRCLPPMEAQSQRLIDAVARLQFSHNAAQETADLLDGFLAELLALTDSSRAVVAEVSAGGRGRSPFEPPLFRVAGAEHDTLHDVIAPPEWRRGSDDFEGLLGRALAARQPVFATVPAGSPASMGVAVPLLSAGEPVAVAALGGRPLGYDGELIRGLTPLCDVVAVTLAARRQGRERQRLAELLRASEERFQEILSSLNDVAWSFSLPDGKMLYLSPGVAEVYGRDVVELLANPASFLDMVHPEDRERVSTAGDEVLRTGSGEIEYRVLLDDGSVRWVHRRAQVIYEADQPLRINGIHTDITAYKALEAQLREAGAQLEKRVEERTALLSLEIAQRKQAEELLRHSEAHYRLLAENSSDMISRHDAEGRYLYVSPSSRTLLGIDPDALIGRSHYELFHPEDVPAFRAAHEHLAQGSGTCVVSYRLRRPDGEHVWVETTCRWVGGENEGREQIIAVTRDITERHRVEAALRQSEARASAAEERRRLETRIQQVLRQESLGALAGGIAHEFNNLLTSIIGFSELARSQMAPDVPQAGYLDQVLASARRAASLTAQMLAYSGKGRFLVQPLRLDELVRGMDQLLRVSITRKCELVYRRLAEMPTIEGDAAQIRQVVLNLVINASEAIGDRQGMITLRFGSVRLDQALPGEGPGEDEAAPSEYALLEVADDGTGMTPEVRARIFDPFFSTRFTGRGLGLPAVQGIVHGHQGVIRVLTEPGQGTTVRVLLPAMKGTATVPNPAPEPTAEAPARPGTILVADDEAPVRELVRRALEREGFAVLTAADGREAVTVFRSHGLHLDVVLLDLTMPHLDGIETMAELRRIRPDIRVILASGFSEQQASERVGSQAPTAFLGKPFRIDELLAVVQRVLRTPTTPGEHVS